MKFHGLTALSTARPGCQIPLRLASSPKGQNRLRLPSWVRRACLLSPDSFLIANPRPVFCGLGWDLDVFVFSPGMASVLGANSILGDNCLFHYRPWRLACRLYCVSGTGESPGKRTTRRFPFNNAPAVLSDIGGWISYQPICLICFCLKTALKLVE